MLFNWSPSTGATQLEESAQDQETLLTRSGTRKTKPKDPKPPTHRRAAPRTDNSPKLSLPGRACCPQTSSSGAGSKLSSLLRPVPPAYRLGQGDTAGSGEAAGGTRQRLRPRTPVRACGEEPSAPSAPGSGQQAAGAGAGKEERVPAGRYLRRQSLLLVVLPGQHPPQLLHAQSWGRAAPRRAGQEGTVPPEVTRPTGRSRACALGRCAPLRRGSRVPSVGPGPGCGNRLISIRTEAICASSAAVNPLLNKAFRGGTGWQRRDGPRPCRSRRSGALAPQREGAWGSGRLAGAGRGLPYPPSSSVWEQGGPRLLFLGPYHGEGRAVGQPAAGHQERCPGAPWVRAAPCARQVPLRLRAGGAEIGGIRCQGPLPRANVARLSMPRFPVRLCAVR